MKSNYFNALVASVGSGLEYFSFITFAFQAPYLAALFFPTSLPNHAIVNTFLIFSAGSFIMFFGGLLFGFMGDRLGRKTTFTASIGLMSLATLGIAILPTGWGKISLSLLIILRILQGISQGAELPGAIAFITEHAHHRNKGFLCGLMFLGVGLGAGLATAVNMLLTHILSAQQMLAFGWRLPFFIAFLLGMAGFILRKYTHETPVFIHMPKVKVRLHYLSLLHGFLLVFYGAFLVSLGLYLPTLLTTFYLFKPDLVFLATMIAFISTAFLLPVFGHLGDRFGRGKLYLIGVTLGLVAYPFLFHLLDSHSTPHLIIFSVIYYLIIVILAGNYPVMLAERFPPQNRYFSIAFCYAGCYTFLSFTPAVAASLFLHPAALKNLLALIEGAGILSLLAGIWYYRRCELN